MMMMMMPSLKVVMPNIAALAEEGVVLEQHYSQVKHLCQLSKTQLLWSIKYHYKHNDHYNKYVGML